MTQPTRSARDGLLRGRSRAIGAVAGGLVATAAWRRHRRSDATRSEVLDAAGVRRLYDRVAPLYDLLACPYELVDGRRLANRAVEELRLGPGDTVVDLGTGTGWALPRLADAVGPHGRVVGVDISAGMLTRARRRVASYDNVELVEADIAAYRLPEGTRAVMSAFAMEMLPDYDAVIARLARELPPDGRLAVTGLRDPERWPEWLVRFASALNRPFGVSNDYRHHRPWEAVRRHTTSVTYVDAIGGAIYVAAGTP